MTTTARFQSLSAGASRRGVPAGFEPQTAEGNDWGTRARPPVHHAAQRLGWDTWGNEALGHVDLDGSAA